MNVTPSSSMLDRPFRALWISNTSTQGVALGYDRPRRWRSRGLFTIVNSRSSGMFVREGQINNFAGMHSEKIPHSVALQASGDVLGAWVQGRWPWLSERLGLWPERSRLAAMQTDERRHIKNPHDDTDFVGFQLESEVLSASFCRNARMVVAASGRGWSVLASPGLGLRSADCHTSKIHTACFDSQISN